MYFIISPLIAGHQDRLIARALTPTYCTISPSIVGHQDGASAPTHHPHSPRPYRLQMFQFPACHAERSSVILSAREESQVLGTEILPWRSRMTSVRSPLQLRCGQHLI